MDSLQFNSFQGDQPLVATAIHNGHQARDEVTSLFAIDDATRLREEDPFTEKWTAIVLYRQQIMIGSGISRKPAKPGGWIVPCYGICNI